MDRRGVKASSPAKNSELSRDVYGFTIRPHHSQQYKKYAAIYKEEEAERSSRWEHFLTSHCRSTIPDLSEPGIVNVQELNLSTQNGNGDGKLEMWTNVKPSLWPVEHALHLRKKGDQNGATESTPVSILPRNQEQPNMEHSESIYNPQVAGEVGKDTGEFCVWRDELDALVRGGVPMALRGELWQVFVGTGQKRMKGHYEALLTLLADGGGDSDGIGGLYRGTSANYSLSESGILEKWTSQIEKDLPRTFPGHPALDEDGRNALRRLLTAYARHNPVVGYCQAMNFFAALLLLMMPEENAFWTLTGFIEDYFEGYYSEKMLEAQVDQLVLEELVRKHFPRLVTHLDDLGLQLAWVTGPWFLSVFVNILPWESVFRVWDVLLYDGNRCMLFRTALALLDQHGSKILATKDAGDAVTVLQSLAASTFDSSQLVLVACMGYQSVTNQLIEEIRLKKRPLILAAHSDCTSSPLKLSPKLSSKRGVPLKLHSSDVSNNSGTHQQEEKPAGMTSGRVSLKLDTSHEPVKKEYSFSSSSANMVPLGTTRLAGVTFDEEEDEEEEICVADLLEQVKWLKLELSRALEECREANSRADELETAFMELVKEDNRRWLSAKVEALECELVHLKQVLADKEQESQTMVQVMLRMEQEQRLSEDARHHAEEDSEAHRAAIDELQRKYEEAIASLSEMEKRTVLAETMLDATLQYQALGSGHVAPKKLNDIISENEDSSRSPGSRLSYK